MGTVQGPTHRPGGPGKAQQATVCAAHTCLPSCLREGHDDQARRGGEEGRPPRTPGSGPFASEALSCLRTRRQRATGEDGCLARPPATRKQTPGKTSAPRLCFLFSGC